MQEGSFFVLVQRQSAVSNWLHNLSHKLGSDNSFSKRFDELTLRAERYCKLEETKLDAELLATPLTFYFPGGAFGLALQETHQVAGGLSLRKQPSCLATKRAAIVFQGYLSNLDELVKELLYGPLPEPGTSYESDSPKGPFRLQSRGDQALLSAEVLLHMFLRSSHDDLPILLSELQGQYSFVIYDSHKRQVFAARDPNGKEPLFVNHGEDSTLSFTNEPSPTWGEPSTWQEVLPGHYLAGKAPKQVQFALTPQQLHMREYVETLEDLSPLAYNGHSIAVPIGVKEDDRSPSSVRSSAEMEKQLDNLFRISV